MNYKFKTKPFKHQLDVFKSSRDKKYFGLLMEQGTGKSKVIVDTAAYLYSRGKINACLIIAPNGVHQNWVFNEVPTHIPDYIPYRIAAWSSTMQKAQREAFNSLYDADYEGLKILAVNVEAYSTGSKKAITMTRSFINGFTTLLVIDESHKIKRPGAKRSKAIMSLKNHVEYRRILTGTMITKGPLDAYMQMRFLHDDILGYDNFYSFRARYAEMEDQVNHSTGKRYKLITGYKNVDELTKKIASSTYRVLKSECLDLPDKLYEKRYVEFGKKQQQYYNQMKKNLLVEIKNEECSASIILTKMLRLQQIIGGFFPLDNGTIYPIEDNKRINAVMDIIEACEGKTIIWARFRQEIAGIVKAIEDEYGKGFCVEYHGGINKDVRRKSIDAFQNHSPGTPQIFIANQQTGGTGITLHAANNVIYYSNDFSLELRLQSEDRAHRIGQKNNVTYFDLEVPGTMDSKLIETLRNKKQIADILMQDPVSNWL